jgi:hypothetical protein
MIFDLTFIAQHPAISLAAVLKRLFCLV